MPRVRNPASRVSTVELLFDLVFVFTITQVTTVVYLVGDSAFRRELRLGPIGLRLAAAVLAAASGLLGMVAASVWQLLVILASALAGERSPARSRAAEPAPAD